MKLVISLSQLKDKYWVREDEFRTNCIFCGDKKKHLYVNVQKNLFHCFRCTVSGIVIDNDVVFLSSQANKKSNILKDNLTENIHLNLNALEYLKERIEDINIIFQLKPFTLDHIIEYKNYVFFNYSNEGIIGRRYIEDEKIPKYLFLKKLIAPYGFFKINKEKDRIFIVEGIFDMIPFIQRNENVVALFGKNLSKNFYNLLETTKQKLYLVLDGDAHKQIDYYCKCYKNLNPIYLPKDKDPFLLKNEIEKFCIL